MERAEAREKSYLKLLDTIVLVSAMNPSSKYHKRTQLGSTSGSVALLNTGKSTPARTPYFSFYVNKSTILPSCNNNNEFTLQVTGQKSKVHLLGNAEGN
jgi:hypothetical protein